ncbi:MAG: AbrB/MazE/SpoVT family DNA-binding domain-containing protein [Candidatus Woesearchaeota archaeon]
MKSFNAKIRRWGRSLGVVIPMDAVKDLRLQENDEVEFMLQKKEDNQLARAFGSVNAPKGWSTMKEIRKARKEEPDRYERWRNQK